MIQNIQTERLTLRRWNIATDLKAFTHINQDPRVLEFLPGALTQEQTQDWIQNIERHFETHGFGLFACTLTKTNELMGFVGLNIPSFEAHFTPCVEIGWRLGSKFWGQGYATEAAKAVLEEASKEEKTTELVSFTTLENHRSRKVMEKLGFTHNPAENFQHPKLPNDHPLSWHVLYRKNLKAPS